jgi:hypothetical protein
VSREKYVWQPGDVQVRDAGNRQACGNPADDDQVPGLCRQCAATIDRDYEWLRDLAWWEAGP